MLQIGGTMNASLVMTIFIVLRILIPILLLLAIGEVWSRIEKENTDLTEQS